MDALWGSLAALGTGFLIAIVGGLNWKAGARA
jgi:hypothetical protein